MPMLWRNKKAYHQDRQTLHVGTNCPFLWRALSPPHLWCIAWLYIVFDWQPVFRGQYRVPKWVMLHLFPPVTPRNDAWLSDRPTPHANEADPTAAARGGVGQSSSRWRPDLEGLRKMAPRFSSVICRRSFVHPFVISPRSSKLLSAWYELGPFGISSIFFHTRLTIRCAQFAHSTPCICVVRNVVHWTVLIGIWYI